MVEQTLDLDELDNHNYVIKSDFHPTLQELAEKLKDVSILACLPYFLLNGVFFVI